MFDIPKAKATLVAFGLATAASALPASAFADGTASDDAPLVLAQAQSFDDDTIDAFATAQTKVQEIRANYAPQLENAASQEEQLEIRQEAGDEMVEAVDETSGIDLEEYNAIIEAAAADTDLAERLDEAVSSQAE